jgi:hypothetical protein
MYFVDIVLTTPQPIHLYSKQNEKTKKSSIFKSVVGQRKWT